MKRIILLILLLAAFILSLSAGKIWISPAHWFAGGADGWIMAELRLPRAILGAAIGAVLGLSGAVLQGCLRNPLADPTVVGVSSSAAFGGVAAIFFGLAAWPYGIFICAMIGAGGAAALLAIMAGRGSGPLGFLLGGMVLSTLAGSLTAFLISISANPYATSEIVSWLMGALTDRSMDDVWRATPFMLVGALLLLITGRSLDALTLGEMGARSIGADLHRLRWMVIAGVAFTVGAAVAVSGVVGFVGLIVPHVMRYWFGERPSAILLPSAVGGAILTMTADALVRLAPGAGEIRLGIVMAVLGTPFFLAILLRQRAAHSIGGGFRDV
ncbi:FecCD family ABC transporter permease [Sphingorhabdus arenilitoris]|uniref:FecCD family ABC transporter permease n=1 Tax=Sphingorhabdus arenilitoris TaxID=1490041 RepID=A0ABV8RJG2_9SPHN